MNLCCIYILLNSFRLNKKLSDLEFVFLCHDNVALKAPTRRLILWHCNVLPFVHESNTLDCTVVVESISSVLSVQSRCSRVVILVFTIKFFFSPIERSKSNRSPVLCCIWSHKKKTEFMNASMDTEIYSNSWQEFWYQRRHSWLETNLEVVWETPTTTQQT